MNIYQQGFREDILNAIFKLTTKTWLKITGAHAIQFVVTMVLALIILVPVFASQFNIMDLASNMDSPEAIIAFYTDLVESIISNQKFLIAIAAFAIVLLFVYSWSTYIQLRISDSQIKKDKIDFVAELKQSFNGEILRILAAFVLTYLITIVLFFIVGALAGISGILTFLLFVGAMIVLLRLFLVIPALIVGKKTMGEAFAWSFQQITWIRALKILGIGFLAILILAVVGIIIGLISAIFTFIPFIGQIVQLGINIFLGGFMAALMTATMLAMYYRYAEDIPENQENDKLELDDLLVSDK